MQQNTLWALGPPGQVVMSFGRHRNKPLKAVPTAYLAWLIDLPNLKTALRQAVQGELSRRGACPLPGQPDDDGDLARHGAAVVCGLTLSAVELALLLQALEQGELVVGLDMPISSPVPLAYERRCQQLGVAARVRVEEDTTAG